MPRTQRRSSVVGSLSYYWKIHLAVVLGVAATSAILTGALLVGDSVRGSLRDLALERLGKIEYALSSIRFFRELLASELEERANAELAPAIIIQGSALHSDSGRRTSGVSVLGIDSRFLELFPASQNELGLDLGQRYQTSSVAINESLRDELEAEIGDSILLSFSKKSVVNPEFLLGRRETSDLQQTLRLTIDRVVPGRSFGRFSLNPTQAAPYNVYLPLEVVQRALNQEGRVNTMLVSGAVSSTMLEEDLRRVATLQDFGLRWRRGGQAAVLESREMLISPSLERAVLRASEDLGATVQPVLTYLANRISSEKRSIPYSMVSAIDLERDVLRNRLQVVSGLALTELNGDEILLNEWAARELKVAVDDEIALTFYVADWQETLTVRSATFRLKGIVSMEGLAVDETLTPEISGVHDAEDMASWNPPIPIDFKQIRPEDEDYWDRYRATPKAFISYEAGLKLWHNRFGRITSARFPDAASPREKIEAALLRTLRTEEIGRFRAIRDEGLQAAAGSTDFGMLFIGFSLFLIVSAVLLVGLLFRLGTENRSHEIGLLLSLGYPVNAVRRRFLVEGTFLAVAGSLFGLALAWTYAGLLIAGLRTIWIGAVGSSFLTLHVEPLTFVTGFSASSLAVLSSLLLTFRSLLQIPATALLRGTTEREGPLTSRSAHTVFAISLAAAIGLLILNLFISAGSSPIVFFGVGTALLVAGLSRFAIWLRRERSSPLRVSGSLASLTMAVRNSARSPGRSLLSAALVASACFVIVAVGANRSQPGADLGETDSGAGGFAVRAECDIPLVRDLSRLDSLLDLGFRETAAEQLEKLEFVSYRLRPGEDVSCRNLYRPAEPRLLGVPEKQVERGGFRFQSLAHEASNPWTLLQEDLGPGVIPAFGDANSVTWILHLALGEDLIMRNEDGEELHLRLVGLLARSIFQSELLISEENFERHFPSQSGYSYFLIEVPPEQIDEATTLLERTLSRYGFDTIPTRQLLAGFFAIENTYLSTFQSLGGLGLLLGTLGLGVILIRNTIERRGELATLRAFGFSRRRLSMLILGENGFLLALGIGLGSLSALVSVGPHLFTTGESVPFVSLLLTLFIVFAVGILASFLSLWVALQIPLLSALREE